MITGDGIGGTMTGTAVAGPNTYSVQAAARIAAIGGNAVDAGLGGMFAALVTEPSIASLGGGAFVTVAVPGRPPVTVDGSVAMPGIGRPAEAFGRGMDSLYLDYGAGVHLDVGPGSVAVPGTLLALELAHHRFGRAPWAEVVGPAAELARSGFVVGRAAGNYLAYAAEPLFGRDRAAREALTGEDGRPVTTGDTMWLPELGDFLDQVIKEGAAVLQQGDAARALVELMAESGGLITAADLAGYRPVIRPALPARIDGWSWATNPAPAVGGPVFAAMLRLLARTTTEDEDRPRVDRVGIAELIEVQRAVLSYRVRKLDLTVDRISAAEELLATIADGRIGALNGSPSTVHVSSVDGDGLACAVTASSGYGAGVSIPGTGIWLNNCLGERELNRRGPHALSPGERLVSNMTPTVGRHDDGRVLAIGSPGADRIATAVLQVVLGLLAGDSLEQAIAAPRVHVSCDDQGTPVTIEYEADLPEKAITAAGFDLTSEIGDGVLPWRRHPAAAMFFGGVAAALRAADGRLEAAADGRREGAVIVLN
jgi:gamma-glutamyltranspeptidase/glutathione hydrolase